MRRFHVLGTLLFLAWIGPEAGHGESPASWWNPQWKSRKRVRVLLPAFQESRSDAASDEDFSSEEEETVSESAGAPSSAPSSAVPLPDSQVGPPATLDTARFRLYGEGLVRPDGGDIRIVSPSGRPAPLRVQPRDDQGCYLVEFKVQPPATDYEVYFGHPEAGPEASPTDWKPRPFAVERVTAQSGIGRPSTYEQATRAFKLAAAMLPPEGLPDINLMAWKSRYPIAPKAFYVSIYQAFLMIDTPGAYEFALAASGSTYLHIDDRLVGPARSPGGNTRHWRPRGHAALTPGVHALRLVHAHSGREGGVRLGWRPPGLHEFVPVSAGAFVDHLAVEEVTYEHLDGPMPVFFSLREPTTAIGLDGQRTAALVRFHDRSPAAGSGAATTREWSLPSSGVAGAPDPSHLILQGQPVRVSLRLSRGGQTIGEYARPVLLRDLPSEPLNFTVDRMRVPSIVYDREQTNLAFSVRNEMNTTLPLTFRWSMAAGDRKLRAETSDMEITAQDHVSVLIPLNLGEFPEGRGEIRLSLSVLDHMAFEQEIRLLHWKDGLEGGRNDLGQIRDAAGRAIILVTSLEDPDQYKRWAPVKWVYHVLDRSAKRVLLLGDPMRTVAGDPSSGPPTYASFLEDLLSPRQESFAFHESRPGVKPILDDLLALPALLQERKPEVLVVSPGLLDVLASTPLADFSRGLDVVIDLARAQPHSAQVVLVSPPPLGSHSACSRLYRDAMRQVAVEHHCPFVDLLGRFESTPEGLNPYFSSVGDGELFYLYPNEAGHRKIAEWILEKLP
ncbi:MAG: hypothetical protein HYU36_14595 [Planctomycetes bacterium]|nr:hypothetical protein [Planctomycetota bacterium]